MKCKKCKSEINSRNDLAIGFLWSSSGSGMFSIIRPYHKKCFISNIGMTGGTAPLTIEQLPRLKRQNYLLLSLFAIAYFYILYAVLKQAMLKSNAFMAVPVPITNIFLAILSSLVFFGLISYYMPISNITIINKIQRMS